MVGRAASGALTLALVLLASCGRDPRVPDGYPRSYARTIRAAEREGKLLIWSATDKGKAAPLVAEFRRAYPDVDVTYVEIAARPMVDRFLAEAARGGGPDVLWSSAMDLQIKLTNDGYAQHYASPEAEYLPRWANWKNQAWGTTAEPIVLVYNRDLVGDADAPRSHAALARWLESGPADVRRRVAGYDVPSSAVGYLYLSQDAQATPDVWRLVDAMRRDGGLLYPRAEDMLQAVRSGRAAFAYDVVGSYALEQARRDPALGMVLFRDYTLLMSRIALISAKAPHPSAAKLFVDFLLSRRGQRRLVEESMPSVRNDVANPAALASRDVPFRAIRVGPGLLVIQDRLTREWFMRRWRGVAGGTPRSNREIMRDDAREDGR